MREYPPIPRTYELMVILSPEVPEEGILPFLETVARYIRDENGLVFEVLRDAPWGRRRLAYPIRYHGRDVRDGYYAVFHFEAVPTAIAGIDRELKLNEDILRYILVKYELPEGQTRPEEIKEGDLLRAAAPAPTPVAEAPATPTPAASEEEAPAAEETAATVATPGETAPVAEPAAEGEIAQAAPVEESAPLEQPVSEGELGGVTETAPTEESAAPVEERPVPAEASAGPDETEPAPEETREG